MTTKRSAGAGDRVKLNIKRILIGVALFLVLSILVLVLSERTAVQKPEKVLGSGNFLTRKWQVDEQWRNESSAVKVHILSSLDSSRTALVLVDVWDEHPNNGWNNKAKKITGDKILPLLALARQKGLLIVHAPHKVAIDRRITVKPGEIVLDKYLQNGADPETYVANLRTIDKLFKERGITTLLYAGYSSNICLVGRIVGIFNVGRLGYRIVLVRDATTGFEYPDTYKRQWANEVAIDTVEWFHESTTLEDIRRALNTK